MEKSLKLNNEQSLLVEELRKLLQKMKKAHIVCYNTKTIDYYEGNTPHYQDDKLVFLNGEEVSKIGIYDEDDIDDEMWILNDNVLTNVPNFIKVEHINDSLDNYSCVACRLNEDNE